VDSEHGELSPAILRERDARFGDLLSAQRERVRRRHSRRAALAVLSLAGVGALLASWIDGWRPTDTKSTEAPYQVIERVGPSSIEIVASVTRPQDRGVEYMDDEAMLAELRSAGFDVGMARIGERVLFVSR
jgi:hypothetical protein